MFEYRTLNNEVFDEQDIKNLVSYNLEQLTYKSEIIDSIVSYTTEFPMLEILAGVGQISFDIASKCNDKNIIIHEEAPIYSKYVEYELTQKHMHNRCTSIVSPANCLPFENESFQIVYSINSLHRMINPQEVILEMYRVLRPSGKIIINDLRRDLVEDFAYYRIRELEGLPNGEWMIKKFLKAWQSAFTLQEVNQLLMDLDGIDFSVIKDGVMALSIEINK